MMNVKTQSPVYINKKEVSSGDFYVNASGKVKTKKPAGGAKPATDKKPGKLAGMVNKGYLADTLAGAKNLFGGKTTDTTIVDVPPADDKKKPGDDKGMSTTKKVVIGVSIAAFLGGLYWWSKRKK